VHRNPATGNARQLEKVLGVEIVAAIPYDPKAAAAHHATELVYDFEKKRLSPPARAYANSNEEHGKVERHREVNRGDRLAIVGQAANRRQRETGQQHPLLTD
ncbi:MAG: hypothetical protein KKB13_20880, partial [Chloroflexi bacterium]|nr:hypothetical protein [Chloroflexota bacterium]